MKAIGQIPNTLTEVFYGLTLELKVIQVMVTTDCNMSARWQNRCSFFVLDGGSKAQRTRKK